MNFKWFKPILLALFYFAASGAGLCGVINHSVSKSRSGEYRPLLEEGKTWKYTLVNRAAQIYPKPGIQIERIREARLEGYETINGEEYMKLNVYYDGSDTPAENNPMCYLKEDTETGKVTFMPNHNFGDNFSWENGYMQELIFYETECIGTPGLLYDFKSTEGRHFYCYHTNSETSVMLADGEHKCYLADHDWRIIEGIGLTSDRYGRGCSILGLSASGLLSLPDYYYDSYLYEVVNGEGQVIYTDERYRPGWSSGGNGIGSVTATPTVKVTDDCIVVSDAYNADACLIDLQGRILERRSTENGCMTISTSGLTSGIYLLRLGARSYKIAVK